MGKLICLINVFFFTKLNIMLKLITSLTNKCNIVIII